MREIVTDPKQIEALEKAGYNPRFWATAPRSPFQCGGCLKVHGTKAQCHDAHRDR